MALFKKFYPLISFSLTWTHASFISISNSVLVNTRFIHLHIKFGIGEHTLHSSPYQIRYWFTWAWLTDYLWSWVKMDFLEISRVTKFPLLTRRNPTKLCSYWKRDYAFSASKRMIIILLYFWNLSLVNPTD